MTNRIHKMDSLSEAIKGVMRGKKSDDSKNKKKEQVDVEPSITAAPSGVNEEISTGSRVKKGSRVGTVVKIGVNGTAAVKWQGGNNSIERLSSLQVESDQGVAEMKQTQKEAVMDYDSFRGKGTERWQITWSGSSGRAAGGQTRTTEMVGFPVGSKESDVKVSWTKKNPGKKFMSAKKIGIVESNNDLSTMGLSELKETYKRVLNRSVPYMANRSVIENSIRHHFARESLVNEEEVQIDEGYKEQYDRYRDDAISQARRIVSILSSMKGTYSSKETARSLEDVADRLENEKEAQDKMPSSEDSL